KRSMFFTAASRRAFSCFNASLISASCLLLRSKTDSATTRVLVSSINLPNFGVLDTILCGRREANFQVFGEDRAAASAILSCTTCICDDCLQRRQPIGQRSPPRLQDYEMAQSIA